MNYPDYHLAADAHLEPPPAQAEERPMWKFFILSYFGLLAIGLPIIIYTKQIVVGAAIFGPLTFFAVVQKPVFGLCLLLGISPMGAVLGFSQYISGGASAGIEKVVGILFAAGTILNIIFTRQPIVFLRPATVGAAILTLLSGFSIAWALYMQVAIDYTLTLLQLFILTALIVTACQGRSNIVWGLRAFVVGCVFSVLLATLVGRGEAKEAERLTLEAADSMVNENLFAAVLGMGALSAFYLFVADPLRKLRPVWILSILILAAGIFATSSRGIMLAMLVTIILPLFLLRNLFKSPGRTMTLASVLALGAVAAYFLLPLILPQYVLWRLTDVEKAARDTNMRIAFIQDSLQYVSHNFLGAGMNCFRDSSGHSVHNDFFFLLSNLGLVGPFFYFGFWIGMAWCVSRIPVSWEKWFAQSIVVFLFLSGQSHCYVFVKPFWSMLAIATIMISVYHDRQRDNLSVLPDPEQETRA